MTDSCATCAKRNIHFETIVMHPSLEGLGYCTNWVNDSSRLWITPDDYWCGEFERPKSNGLALDEHVIPTSTGTCRVGDLTSIRPEQIEDSKYGFEKLTLLLKESPVWSFDANGVWTRR